MTKVYAITVYPHHTKENSKYLLKYFKILHSIYMGVGTGTAGKAFAGPINHNNNYVIIIIMSNIAPALHIIILHACAYSIYLL